MPLGAAGSGYGWKRLRLEKIDAAAGGIRVGSEARSLLENPPEGVDLAALTCKETLLSPEDCKAMYEQAFVEAGGKRAVQASKAISERLEVQMKLAMADHCGWNRCLYAAQLQVWESYGLDFMMKRMGKGSAVRQYGERLLNELFKDVKQNVSSAVELTIADAKKFARSSIKVRIKYAGDCSQLGDMNRATIACPDIQVMYAVADLLFERWGPMSFGQQARIVEFSDHYQKPMAGGYRHLQLLIYLSGSLWELQLNTEPMQEAKKKAGHKLYKTTRFVKEMILFASMEGDANALRDLLAKPGVRELADPNAVKDRNGLSALHHAAFRGDADVLALLLSKDACSKCADAWALDGTHGGGLPINYAMLMHHYSVALTLARHMADSLPEHIAPASKARLAEVIAAVVDAHETQMNLPSDLSAESAGAESAPRKEVEELLRSCVKLWNSIGGHDAFKGVDPFTYAFVRKAKNSANIFFEFADLWLVDSEGMLPIERAASLGLLDAAQSFSSKMLASRPERFPPEAVFSLARCRRQGRFPDELVGEFIISDQLLRHMADNMHALERNCESSGSGVHQVHKGANQQRRDLEKRSEGGWGTQRSMNLSRKLPLTERRGGGNLLDVDPWTHRNQSVTQTSARIITTSLLGKGAPHTMGDSLRSSGKLDLPPIHTSSSSPPSQKQRARSSQAPRAAPPLGDQGSRTAR